MTTATAMTIDPDAIPIVDIGPLRDGSDPKGVAQALHAASKGLGFIYNKRARDPGRCYRGRARVCARFFPGTGR